MGCKKTWLLVHVAHRTKVTTDDLEVGILPHVVLGHFKHAEVEVSYRTEAPACHQDDRSFAGIAQGLRQAVMREGVIWRIGEVRSLEWWDGHGRQRERRSRD